MSHYLLSLPISLNLNLKLKNSVSNFDLQSPLFRVYFLSDFSICGAYESRQTSLQQFSRPEKVVNFIVLVSPLCRIINYLSCHLSRSSCISSISLMHISNTSNSEIDLICKAWKLMTHYVTSNFECRRLKQLTRIQILTTEVYLLLMTHSLIQHNLILPNLWYIYASFLILVEFSSTSTVSNSPNSGTHAVDGNSAGWCSFAFRSS